MGNFIKSKIKKIRIYLDKHKKTRTVVEYLSALIVTGVSALLCAFAFKAFMSPNSPTDAKILPLISGGISGIARTIALVFEMCKSPLDMYQVYSITYFILNIPMLYIGFRFIGFRFGLFSAINVALVSIFTNFVKLDFVDTLAEYVACVIKVGDVHYQAGLLSRVILSAVFNGVSSSIAFAAGTSAGGSDIVSYYFSLRKSTNVGKYVLGINIVVMILFSSLSFADSVVTGGGFKPEYVADAFLIILFAFIYSCVLVLVIDFINRRNKKEQIQIITKEENLPKLLLANIPHGATIVRSKGAFTGEDRIIIYCIVSIYETNNVVELVRSADPKSFINITTVKQVYGRFFIKPIK